MKSLKLTFVALSLSAITAFGQQESSPSMQTIFGDPEVNSIGGYGALGLGYTTVADRDALYFSAQGAVVINHSIAIGAGGKGFASKMAYDNNLGAEYNYAGGYGGLIIEPILDWDRPIHFSFPVLIGGGGIGYIQHWGDYDNNDEEYDFADEDSNAFFVIEPGIEVELNLVKWMRMAATISYRYTSDIKLGYKNSIEPSNNGTMIGSEDMLRGFNVGINMKFGKF